MQVGRPATDGPASTGDGRKRPDGRNGEHKGSSKLHSLRRSGGGETEERTEGRMLDESNRGEAAKVGR